MSKAAARRRFAAVPLSRAPQRRYCRDRRYIRNAAGCIHTRPETLACQNHSCEYQSQSLCSHSVRRTQRLLTMNMRRTNSRCSWPEKPTTRPNRCARGRRTPAIRLRVRSGDGALARPLPSAEQCVEHGPPSRTVPADRHHTPLHRALGRRARHHSAAYHREPWRIIGANYYVDVALDQTTT
jgi:hypothetical protein